MELVISFQVVLEYWMYFIEAWMGFFGRIPSILISYPVAQIWRFQEIVFTRRQQPVLVRNCRKFLMLLWASWQLPWPLFFWSSCIWILSIQCSMVHLKPWKICFNPLLTDTFQQSDPALALWTLCGSWLFKLDFIMSEKFCRNSCTIFWVNKSL